METNHLITSDELIRKVETNMEELLPDGEFDALEFDGMNIREYIRLKLPEAMLQLFLKAPYHILPLKELPKETNVINLEDGSGIIALPSDWLRMTELRMKGWRRSVFRFYSPNDPEYDRQWNKYLRGGTEKPAAIIELNDKGEKVMHYFSLPLYVRLHEIEKAIYIPYPPTDLQDEYYLHPQLVSAIGYTCAAIIYTIMGQPDKATLMNSHVLL